jgi:hypothetical protein
MRARLQSITSIIAQNNLYNNGYAITLKCQYARPRWIPPTAPMKHWCRYGGTDETLVSLWSSRRRCPLRRCEAGGTPVTGRCCTGAACAPSEESSSLHAEALTRWQPSPPRWNIDPHRTGPMCHRGGCLPARPHREPSRVAPLPPLALTAFALRTSRPRAPPLVPTRRGPRLSRGHRGPRLSPGHRGPRLSPGHRGPRLASPHPS